MPAVMMNIDETLSMQLENRDRRARSPFRNHRYA
jgi:hypothetical protein